MIYKFMRAEQKLVKDQKQSWNVLNYVIEIKHLLTSKFWLHKILLSL